MDILIIKSRFWNWLNIITTNALHIIRLFRHIMQKIPPKSTAFTPCVKELLIALTALNERSLLCILDTGKARNMTAGTFKRDFIPDLVWVMKMAVLLAIFNPVAASYSRVGGSLTGLH